MFPNVCYTSSRYTFRIQVNCILLVLLDQYVSLDLMETHRIRNSTPRPIAGNPIQYASTTAILYIPSIRLAHID
jgi:hypothetical protein